MKKQLLFAVPALSLCFGMAATNTFATSYSEITDYTKLKECMEQDVAASCSLGGDIALTTNIDVKSSITLDLNGNTISYASTFAPTNSNAMLIVLRGGSLTINDSVGTGKVTAKDGSNNSNKIYTALQVTKKGESSNGTPAVLTINGGTFESDYYAITGNGDRQDTQITINGGTLTGIKEGGTGIFHPQRGTLTINGGSIAGSTGIYMKSGTLNVNGGTVIGNGERIDYTFTGNGFESTGDAIVIDNCNYPGGAPAANITGGTIKSVNNQALASYIGNGVEEENVVIPAITGGVFVSAIEPLDINIPEGFEKVETADGWIVRPIVVSPNKTAESTVKTPNSGYVTNEANATASFVVAFMLAGSAILTFAGVKFYNRKNS